MKGDPGGSIIKGFSNSLSSYEGSKIKPETKKQMLLDVDVQFALQALISPIASSEWSVECSDPDIVLFLEAALLPLWRGLIQAALEAVPFGFQGFEKIYERRDVEIQDKGGEIQILPQRAVYKELYDIDPEKVKIKKNAQGDLEGLEVNEKLIKIDISGESIDKGAIITLPRVRWGNHGGIPRLDIAYGPWWTKSATMRLMLRYLERHGDPPVIGEAPRGQVYDEQGVKHDNLDLMLSILTKIKGGSNVSIPHVLDEKGEQAWIIRLLEESSSSSRGSQWLEVLEHLSVLIMRAFLSPEKTLVEGGQAGSYALVKEQRTIALQNAESIQSTIFEQLSNQILSPLVLANFGRKAPKARLVPGALDKASIELLSEILGFIVDYEKGQIPDRPLTELIDRVKLLETLRVPLDQDLDSKEEDPDKISIQSKEGSEGDLQEGSEGEIEEGSEEALLSGVELASFKENQRKYLKLVREKGEAFKREVQDPILEKQVEKLIRDTEKALNAGTPIQQMRALSKIEVNSKEYQKALEGFLVDLHEIGRKSLAEELDLKRIPNLSPEDREFIKLLSGSLAEDRASTLRKLGSVASEGGVRWGQKPEDVAYEIRQRSEKLLKNRSNQTTATSEAWRGFQDGRRSVAEQEMLAEDPIWAAEFQNENPKAQICKDLAGEIIRADDPRFFAYHPPLHHNCNTTIRYLRRSEYERINPPPFKRPSQTAIDSGDDYFFPKELMSLQRSF